MTESLKALISKALTLDGPAGVILEGWCGPDRGIELAQLILDEKPKVVVEIGVFGGRSLLAQAFALRELGEGHIYGIDPWKKEDSLEGEEVPANRTWWSGCDHDAIHAGAMKAIWEHKLDSWVTIIRSASQHCHQLFTRIDCLSIDGNHSEVSSCRDVENYVPKVRYGGVILFDDANWQSTQAALSRLDQVCDLIKNGGSHRIYRKR